MEDEQRGRAGSGSPGKTIGHSQDAPLRQRGFRAPGGHVTVTRVLLLFLGALAGVCSAFCPSPCSCDRDLLSATCEGGNFDVVPYQLNPDIRNINLTGNKIVRVHYSLSSYHNLRNLDLSSNRIPLFSVKDFNAQTKLITLNISSNEIRELIPGTFHALRTLRVLNLSNNYIEILEEGLFQNQENLWELYLSNNSLSYIGEGVFESMVNLRVLNLEKNSLTSVPTSNLQTLLSLRELRLGGNYIEYVGEYALPILKEMLILSLDYNNVSEIHATAFDGLHALELLDLSGNNLTDVPTSQLSKLTSLVELDLSGNSFQSIGPVAFKSLFYLQRLWLAHQPHLRYVDPRAFVDNTHLEAVALEDNPHLSVIPQKLFHNNPLIQDILLRDNGITTLTSSHFPVKLLQTLYLSGNPLFCNCTLLWLWKQVHQVNTTPRIDEVTCGGPPSVQGFYVADVPESEVLCETPWMAVLMVTVSVMALFALTCGVLFFFGNGRCCNQPPETLTQNGTLKDPTAFQHTIATWDTAKQLDDSYENEYMDVSMISTKSAPIVYV